MTSSNMVEQVPRADAVPSIVDLCPEMLLKIFKCLPLKELSNVAQVCRLWREIAYSCKALWVDATLDSAKFDLELLSSLQERGIQRVRFVGGGSSIHTVMTCLPRLTGVEVYAVPDLARWFYHQRLPEQTEDMKIFLSFVQELEHTPLLSLKYLKLDGVCNANNEVIRIVKHTPNVESFSLRLSDSELVDSDIVEILASLKHLKSLTLEYCKPVGFHCGNASDYRSDSLQHLCLVKCKNINDNSIRTLSRSLMSLREIHVINCSNLSDSCFQFLAQMKKLQRVTLNRCLNITKAGRGYFLKATNLTAHR